MVFESEHGDTWDVAALIRLLNRSQWSVFAYAADETGFDPNESPTNSVASNTIKFEKLFHRAVVALRQQPSNNRLQATAGGLGGARPARWAFAHRA
jgi:hypothetical protein